MGTSILVAVFGIVFGAIVLALVPTHAGHDGYAAFLDVQSPAFFPLLLSTLLVVISTAFLCLSLYSARRGSYERIAGEQGAEGEAIEAPFRLAATAATLVAYYVLLSWIGMLAASVLLILVLSIILGFRRHLITVAVAILLPVAVYMLFQRGLYVMLPEGHLF